MILFCDPMCCLNIAQVFLFSQEGEILQRTKDEIRLSLFSPCHYDTHTLVILFATVLSPTPKVVWKRKPFPIPKSFLQGQSDQIWFILCLLFNHRELHMAASSSRTSNLRGERSSYSNV